MTPEQTRFINRVSDYAVRNGYEITEAGFEQAMNDYIADWKSALAKFNKNRAPITELMFAKAMVHTLTT